MELREIFDIVRPISDEAYEQIENLTTLRKVKAHEYIIEEGKLSREIFFVKSGIFRNFALNDDKEHTRWFAEEGDIICSMFSFVMKQRAIATVEALTDAELYVASSQDMRELIENSFEWSKWISRYLIEGLYAYERRYTFLGTGDALTRYENLLRMRQRSMLDKIPLQHIASYLNITPQTLSKIRRTLLTGGSK